MSKTFVPKTDAEKLLAKEIGRFIYATAKTSRISCKELAAKVKLSKSSMSRVTCGKTLPITALRKEIFSILGAQDVISITPEEQVLLMRFRYMSPEQRKATLCFLSQ